MILELLLPPLKIALPLSPHPPLTMAFLGHTGASGCRNSGRDPGLHESARAMPDGGSGEELGSGEGLSLS